MMKKIIPLLLATSMLCNNVYAQSIPSPDPETDEKTQIAPMFPGDRAPFTGVLFSTKATATVLAELDSFQDKLSIEVKKVQRDAEAQKKFELSQLDAKRTREKDVIKADLDAQQKVNVNLKQDVKRLEDEVANAPNRLLWASMGVAGGVLVTVLITFAVNQASK